MAHRVFYRLVYDWAGIKNGRASSPFLIFADANRAAMKLCAETSKPVRIYVMKPNAFAGELVVEYEKTNDGGVVVANAS